jgi:threonine/homoserine/homoserine lactone efflux protein
VIGWSALLAFFALELTLCLIPGPAVLFTVATTLRRGGRHGCAAIAGIVAGNTTYFVLSGAGVAALLLASYDAFAVVKYGGAAYLAYLGVRALCAEVGAARSPDEPRARTRGLTKAHALELADGSAAVANADRVRAFRGALVTQLANPKAIVFFVAILPQFIDPRGNVPLQIASLALVSAVAETLVLSGYVALAERIRRSTPAVRARLWVERAGGAILIAIAARLAREPIALAH